MKAIEYKNGDSLGSNNHKFIKEVTPAIQQRSSNSKYTISFRRAEFECGLCSKLFENKIQLIKSNIVLSCGCLQKTKLKEWHKSKGKK